MMKKNILKITLAMIIAGLSQTMHAFDGPKPPTTSDKTPTSAAPELSDDALDAQQVAELIDSYKKSKFSKETFTVLKKIRERGKSAYALVYTAGYDKFAARLHRETEVREIDAQKALIAAAKKGFPRMVTALLEEWGSSSHSHLGWAREEAVEIAMKNNDYRSLQLALTEKTSPTQLDILEADLNSAYNDVATRLQATTILKYCTPKQQTNLWHNAMENGHLLLARYIKVKHQPTISWQHSDSTIDKPEKLVAEIEKKPFIIERTQTPDSQISKLRDRRSRDPNRNLTPLLSLGRSTPASDSIGRATPLSSRAPSTEIVQILEPVVFQGIERIVAPSPKTSRSH